MPHTRSCGCLIVVAQGILPTLEVCQASGVDRERTSDLRYVNEKWCESLIRGVSGAVGLCIRAVFYELRCTPAGSV